MNKKQFKKYKKFLEETPTGYGLTAEQKQIILEIADSLNWEKPKCNCGDKYNSLLSLEKRFFKDKKDIKYIWCSSKSRFKFEDIIFTKYNYTDEQVERYIESNPEQTDFKKI